MKPMACLSRTTYCMVMVHPRRRAVVSAAQTGPQSWPLSFCIADQFRSKLRGRFSTTTDTDTFAEYKSASHVGENSIGIRFSWRSFRRRQGAVNLSVTESPAIVSSGHPQYKGPQPRSPPYATTGPGLLIPQGKSCDDLTRMTARRRGLSKNKRRVSLVATIT
jgi:hypothetical protein